MNIKTMGKQTAVLMVIFRVGPPEVVASLDVGPAVVLCPWVEVVPAVVACPEVIVVGPTEVGPTKVGHADGKILYLSILSWDEWKLLKYFYQPTQLALLMCLN